MTPNLSLPAAAKHADLVQRRPAMTTAPSLPGPPPARHLTKTPPPQPEAVDVKATQSCTRADSVFDDGDSMAGHSALSRQPSNSSDDSNSPRRPTTPRAHTDPAPDLSAMFSSQPRNRSPYARSHLRSHSSSASLSAPVMTRAHSLPTVMHTAGPLSLSPPPLPLARPSSPLRSPNRTRSPRGLEPRPLTAGPCSSGIRPASLGSFEGSPSVCDISEDAELELTPRAAVSGLYSSTGSLSRRRRPASPLHHVYVPFGAPPTGTPIGSTPTSGSSSPLFAPTKFNEQYPSSLASSSVPSTPTSMRSRSPSISSLETIEDSPDAEEAAIEADRIAKLKAAADREDGGDQRRSSLDVPERGRTFGFGKRDSRKRWSVCGAERRGDLDLETIWED
ncbi:hypothetical protein BDU57DRAFT_446787 [Ampelomyces quisqualis]|uniref:Basic proline-rich protein n=1 Tax=Ampelomyces quisqualis TaxID=50730 RepID=A0A6A5QTX8_AMPQU|nr:hypothetical protein BDU57DRAFT_446787 [Ampelomyces quisqualis]